MKLLPGIAAKLHSACMLSVFLLLPGPASHAQQNIHVSVSAARANRGQTVEISFQGPQLEGKPVATVNADILEPFVGVKPLTLEVLGNGRYKAVFAVAKNAGQGIYAVRVRIGSGTHPIAAGKATFLVGKVTADFFEPAHLDQSKPGDDLKGYLDDFSGLGGNLIIAHSIITPDRAYFSCAICRTSPARGSSGDIVEMLLRQADARGLGVLLSVGWDMTRHSPYQNRWAETQSIMRELYRLYGSHLSFLGFYVYQEGSGIYYVPYVRKFTRLAKELNPGLLTACAPYVDDPLLAGYLGDLPDLDIILYQAMVMASYRPDNRERFPIRRVKDFCSLSAGAKKLQHKIALTHVELFGYKENDLGLGFTNYRNQYQQFLSAATVADNDGIALFAYQPLIYSRLKSYPQAAESRRAVVDGLRAFRLLSPVSAGAAPLEAYVPYSDWVADRWSQSYLPAFDAFRVMGIPLGVLPYSPPTDESLLPYYPMDPNPYVLARLLRTKVALVLPNVSGFQRTDSELIKDFVHQGGVVIAFGPQIPMGVGYKRSEVFGLTALSPVSHEALIVRNALGKRVPSGSHIELPQQSFPAWKSAGAKIIATFEDGSAAIAVNRYGQGTAVTVATDAMTAARCFPALVRDVLDAALATDESERAVDIIGASVNIDVAISKTSNGFRAAVVNHNRAPLTVTLQPLNKFAGQPADWLDLEKPTQTLIFSGSRPLTLVIPAGGFRAVEWRPAAHSPAAHHGGAG